MAELEIGSRFAGYRIDGVLGRGGMGRVYRAWDVRLERPVAVKVITSTLAEDRRIGNGFGARRWPPPRSSIRMC